MNVTGRFFGPLHPSHYSLALSLSLSLAVSIWHPVERASMYFVMSPFQVCLFGCTGQVGRARNAFSRPAAGCPLRYFCNLHPLSSLPPPSPLARDSGVYQF